MILKNYLSENINMGSISWKVLLMEVIEDRGYAKGYTDGQATGRVAGRQQGISIARRRIAQALLCRNSLSVTVIAEVTDLSVSTIESLRETS